MSYKRSSGILLHPTSLPGPDGLGDLGADAHQWVLSLSKMGFEFWQILPLGPTGYGDSPYQCFSAFAGNPLLINSLFLVEDGLLTFDDLADRPAFSNEFVDYGKAIPWKNRLLNTAFSNFKASPRPELKKEFDNFCQKEHTWLDDYALFMAIKDAYHGEPWNKWAPPLKMREKDALLQFSNEHHDSILCHQFRQLLFFRQWQDIKQYANSLGIKIIGDIPIFVAYDSADAWSNPDLFYFDKNRDAIVVAGVPPDYFSVTGQLWGNPLYLWKTHQDTAYDWWIKRIKSTLALVDIIRLDHFRGFVDYWEIPAGMPTAEIGQWKPGPGKGFFDAIKTFLGDLPLIAEDLGQINPQVYQLRDELALPGMKILQFGFGNGPEDNFLPHNYPIHCVAYTGTHDNDTAIGWFETAQEKEKDFCRRYLNSSGEDIAWDMIRCIWASVANIAIAPLQDFLQKGSEARMNFPGRASGNWAWRFQHHEITPELINRIAEINYLYGRTVNG